MAVKKQATEKKQKIEKCRFSGVGRKKKTTGGSATFTPWTKGGKKMWEGHCIAGFRDTKRCERQGLEGL